MSKLREGIKELEHQPPRKSSCLYHPYEQGGLHYDPFVANPICSDCFAAQVLALFKEAGYVKMAEDQSPPDIFDKNTTAQFPVRKDGYVVQRDMLNEGWRKVELL